MAQHDYVINNQSGAAFRSDLNNALAAIVSQNSGGSEPSTTYAYMQWADTAAGVLKLRNGANSAWIVLRELDGTLTIEDGSVSAPGLAFADDLNTGIYSPGNDQLAIATNGVQRVNFNGSTEVVFNDGGANVDFRVEGDTQPNLFFIDASADEIYINGGVFVGTPGTGDAQINVGTGATGNRTTYVDLIGDTTYTDFGLRLIREGTGANANSVLHHRGTGNLGLYSPESGPIVFTNGASSSKFDASNNLLIGYASSNGSYRLQVNSQIFATSATIATSDGRYKENVATLNGCLELVKALRPVSFTWKPTEDICRVDSKGQKITAREGHNFPSGTQVGFIAQEVQEVLADKPWLDSVIKENVRPEVKDADGSQLAPEERFYGIAEGNLIAVLTRALQEAVDRIEDIEAQLQELNQAVDSTESA